MEKYAQIPFIRNGVVFSDPAYDASVWLQYRKDFQADNWLLKMESKTEDNFISFSVMLGRSTAMSGVNVKETGEGMQVSYPARYNVQDVEIGMDTARIYCGLTEHLEAFPDDAAIHTGTDGFFGDLMVFTCKGEKDPAGFLLFAGLEETFMNEKELFQHFLSSFSGKEITREQFEARTNPNSLEVKLLTSSEIKHTNEAGWFGPQKPEKENER